MRATAEIAIDGFKRLSSTELIILDRRLTARRVRTPALVTLVLASYQKFLSQPPGFGTRKGSLDAVLQPFFGRLRSDKKAAQVGKALTRLHERRVARLRPARGHESPALYYERMSGEVDFGECVTALVRERLLPAELMGEAAPAVTATAFRRVHATITEIRCEEPEELLTMPSPGDEVYFLSGGTLFDAEGSWSETTHCSEVTSPVADVPPFNVVRLHPPGVERMLDARLRRPGVNDLLVLPVTAHWSVTLVEHEYGDTKRVYEAFSAAYTAGKLLAALVAGSATGVGVALAIVGILISLAVALDGDDELGTATFLFEDVTAGPTVDLALSADISGEHLGNEYRYVVQTSLRTEDEVGPAPEVRIRGDLNLWATGQTTIGTYAAEFAGRMHSIRWDVRAVQVPDLLGAPTVLLQGGLTTRIQFRGPGIYELSVSAVDDVDGRPLADTCNVQFRSTQTSGSQPGSGGSHPTNPL
jgi:hypothetical protein